MNIWTFDPFSVPISNWMFKKLIGKACKKNLDNFILNVINQTESMQDIDIAMFDFIARYYVYHLGQIYYHNSKSFFGIMFKKAFKAILLNSGNFNERLNDFKEGLIGIYEDSVPILNYYANTIINTLKERGFSLDDCELLQKRYCLSTILDYTRIEIPDGYPKLYEKEPNILIGVVICQPEFRDRLDQLYGSYLRPRIGEADFDKIYYYRMEYINNIIFRIDL